MTTNSKHVATLMSVLVTAAILLSACAGRMG